MTAGALPASKAYRFWHPISWSMLVAAVGLAQQAWSSIDCDVSWLITTAERVLDGATLYRDIEEVNPPASVLIYMPAVALARWLALRVEAVTVGMVAVLAGFSILQAGRILNLPVPTRGPLAAAAAFVLLVLPADLFAQREHIALIMGLPMLALLVTRIEGRSVGRIDVWTAGFGAGIMVAIKPHLVLGLLPVVGWAIMRQRSLWRALGSEWIALGVLCIGYAAAVLLAFPLYLERMLPLLRLVYLPGRDSWAHLLTGTMVLIPAVLAALTVWLARGRVTAPAAAAMLAAGGFVVAGLVQGKGYLNHGYPAVAMGFLAVALELSRPGKAGRLGALCGAVFALISTYGYAHLPEPYALRDAVVRAGPPHPKLIGVSFDFGLGHPLTRWVGGRWVGRRGSLWVTGNARQQLEDPSLAPARRAAFNQAEAKDAAMLAADIVRERPDIVLVDANPGNAWIAVHPVVGRSMMAYHPKTKVGAVTLWVRR
jgi:hypothetical protein